MPDGTQSKPDLYGRTITRLRENKIRITPQREEIIRNLIESDSHPTADEIYQALSLKFSGMSLATVYNNLNMLLKMSIIREIKYGDDSSRYDFISQQHYHVICENCGKIVDLYYPILTEVENFAAQITNFDVHYHSLEIYGLCPNCQIGNENPVGQ